MPSNAMLMLMVSNADATNNDDIRFWVKDVRKRTTVILASRAAPPLAAGSQKMNFKKDLTFCKNISNVLMSGNLFFEKNQRSNSCLKISTFILNTL